jgi:predicted nucleic acid-binding protein
VIYAAAIDHPLGRIVRRHLASGVVSAIGSVLLIPETLSRPIRRKEADERAALVSLLGHIDLIPTSLAIAQRSAALGAKYALRAPDAIHLATAVDAGADRFITNNRRDFTKSISEIDITYPEELPQTSDLAEN